MNTPKRSKQNWFISSWCFTGIEENVMQRIMTKVQMILVAQDYFPNDSSAPYCLFRARDGRKLFGLYTDWAPLFS